MSVGDRTVRRLPEIVAELRDHKLNHGGLQCPICDLWNIYTRGSKSELDAFIARIKADGPHAINAELVDAARTIRAELGEGAWVNT